MSEPTSVAYFCPGSCKNLATEEPRDTGEKYYVPGDDHDDDTQLVTSPQTRQQQQQQQLDTSVSKTQAKPEPGTFYSIPETCLSGDISVCVY